MGQQDKRSVENIIRAMSVLPAREKEYLVGFADGMAALSAMSAVSPQQSSDPTAPQS